MKAIEAYQTRILEAIREIELPEAPAELYEPFRYIMELGGKRMRPLFTLMGCELFGTDAYQAMPQAMAVEIFHNFSLVHDDIMDQAPLRRNKPTVHKKWNSDIALLSGDAMLVYAYKYLMRCDTDLLPRLLEVFNQTAIEVCEGQQYDMNFEHREDVTLEEYTEMIWRKTAALVAGALSLGAIVGRASDADAQRLRDFGLNLGIAFQLQDDLLDVFGDPGKFGKRVGGDIVANKKTWLMIRTLEVAKGEDRAELDRWLANSEQPEEKVAAVTTLYEKLNISGMAREKMEHHYTLSMQALQDIEVPDERKVALRALADLLMQRDH